jgi:hypothetical protein
MSDPADEPITAAEASNLLAMTPAQMSDLLGGDDQPAAIHQLTLRHALALRVTDSLLPLVTRDTAIRTGVSAGRDASLDLDRVLVIAIGPDGEPGACWRDVDADWRLPRPFLAVPGDWWLKALRIGLDEHRAAAARLN